MQERINAILAQETLNESDVAFVMKNLSLVSEIGKARLGLVPVVEGVAEKIEAPIEEPTEVETPKKVAKKITKKK
jgi:hypothetical protein